MASFVVSVFWRILRAGPEELVGSITNGKYIGIETKTNFAMISEVYHGRRDSKGLNHSNFSIKAKIEAANQGN